MISKKHKLILTAVSVLVLIGLSVTALAVAGGKKPSVQTGGYENLIADRIEIKLENTDFVLKKSSADAEKFTLTFFLSLKKTQADFYALVDSFDFYGISYDSIVFTALNEESEGKTLDGLILPAENGQAKEMKWQIDVSCSFVGKGSYEGKIKLMHTTGITQDTSQQKITEIPVTVTVD
ncbi:MAG: hypothetical protein IKL47_07950 [Clostridia bacterium]|nr:hypothetical protein [Clostridia bacterium]